MKTIKIIFLGTLGFATIWVVCILLYFLTNLVIYGREYTETFEEVHYDYRLYLDNETIRIETEITSEMIHPDSLEEFIIRDNL